MSLLFQGLQTMGHAMRKLTNLGQEMQRELASGGRSAIRFPVHLQVQALVGGQTCTAETENFSSSGALFRTPVPLAAGSNIHFLIEIPEGLIGTDITAAIDGEGQVVRSYVENGQNYSAIVIHEYRFQ